MCAPAYFDAGDRGGSTSYLKKFDRSLDDTTNPVSLIRTLRQLASSTDETEVQPILNASESASSVQYLLYNDQPDNAQPSSSYGHTKGVLAMQGSDAIWYVLPLHLSTTSCTLTFRRLSSLVPHLKIVSPPRLGLQLCLHVSDLHREYSCKSSGDIAAIAFPEHGW